MQISDMDTICPDIIASVNTRKFSNTVWTQIVLQNSEAEPIPSIHGGAGAALLGCSKGVVEKKLSAFLMTNAWQPSMCFATSFTVFKCVGFVATLTAPV